MTPELPGTYINLLAEIVKRRGISCEQFLEGSGVTPEQLKKPYWYVEFNTLNNLIEHAI
ncbi:AraC type DNA binding domain containing protein [Acinetobacter baumannii]|nr:AraC type DNA binding domain containing protein [Acinetobacter baumannii]SSQ39686.1 AraC type DNA binding domain containing protein [Acinetobacter baumannii]SVJ99061.1 AraC type DNA binding domain containing protein [Acinetobacter baumannii]